MARRTILALLIGAAFAVALPMVAAQAQTSGPHAALVIKRTGKVSHAKSIRDNWQPIRAEIRRYARRHHLKLRPVKKPPVRKRAAVVTLSRTFTSAPRAATASTPPISNVNLSFTCSVPVNGPGVATIDSDSFTNEQDGYASVTQTCSGIGPAGQGSSKADCSTTPGPTRQGLFATFADGEYAGYCNDPGPPQSSSSVSVDSPTTVSQGFVCEATVATGDAGNTPTNIRTTDSIEGGVPYDSISGDQADFFTSLTTVCVGQVPAATAVPSIHDSHTVACTQAGEPGVSGGAPVQGYGISVTFPDHQFSETCNTPDYALATGL
jgi:hypothetical protein